MTAEAERVAEEAGVELDLRTAAWSPGTEFPEDVRKALLLGLRPPKPRVVCYAGHDAGVIAARAPGGHGARAQRDRREPLAGGGGHARGRRRRARTRCSQAIEELA